MPAPVCTNKQFLAVWEQYKSPSLVARALGISERAVHSRKRRIEQEIGKPLPVKDQRFKFRVQKQDYSQRVQMGIEDGVVITFSDAHFWPGLYSTAYIALLHLIEELQPKAVVANGDVFDGAGISRHPRIGWDKAPSVIEELKACTTALGEIEETAKKARRNVKLYWPLGNHDARFETFLAANAPQYEHVHGFSLRDHFPEWQPCWSVWNGDHTVIKHRLKGGVHATHNNTMTAGVNIVTGHLHSLKVSGYTDYRGTRYGVDTGTLAEPRGPQFENYTEQGPLNWRSGFAVLTFHKGRLLMPELVQVCGSGEVEFRGQVLQVAEPETA
jgi:hypothetical protein